MSNQQIVASLNLGFSADRKLPGMDSVNVDNFNVQLTNNEGTILDPKSFILLPGASVTIAFISAEMLLLLVKSDSPLNLKFGVGGQVFPIASFFALDGNAQSLGSLILTNPDQVATANVQISEIGK